MTRYIGGLSPAMLRALEPYRDDPAHSEPTEDARIPQRTADALVRLGLLEVSTSPAGFEHWYITSAGRAALAAHAPKRGADDTTALLGGRHGDGPRPPSTREPKARRK